MSTPGTAIRGGSASLTEDDADSADERRLTMKLSTIAASALFGATFVMTGCDDQSATPAAPAPAVTETKVDATVSDATADVKAAAADAKDKIDAAAADAKAKTDAAVAEVKDKAGDAMSAVTEQASKLLEDAKAAISANKLDDASKYVDQLKGLRDKLPADWQAKIDAVVKQFDSAKALMGNIPGMK
jgi:hypothetical protein